MKPIFNTSNFVGDHLDLNIIGMLLPFQCNTCIH